MAKPVIATQSTGAIEARNSPAAPKAADTRSVVTAPRRLRTVSPRNRMIAIAPAKNANASPEDNRPEFSSLPR